MITTIAEIPTRNPARARVQPVEPTMPRVTCVQVLTDTRSTDRLEDELRRLRYWLAWIQQQVERVQIEIERVHR